MNVPLITRAAEGYDRRAFTVTEVKAMVRAGIMDEDEPVELWEGEFVPMNAKHNRHEIWKMRLMRKLARALPDEIEVSVGPTLYLSETSFLDPDLLIYATGPLPVDVRGPDCLLVVEIADTSLARDLQGKARLYALHGVRHYWVLDAENRRAHLLSRPDGERYMDRVVVEVDGELTLPFEPSLKIRLADLG